NLEIKLGANKATAASKKDRLLQVENVLGGLGHDVIKGKKGTNILFGDAGNDKLSGKAGNDILIGGEGADIMNGGKGFDFVSYAFHGTDGRSRGVGVVVHLREKIAESGHADGDRFKSIEGVIGSFADDTITGR